MFKKKKEEVVVETKTEKEELLELYNRLIELKITRISDLENMIANI